MKRKHKPSFKRAKRKTYLGIDEMVWGLVAFVSLAVAITSAVSRLAGR